MMRYGFGWAGISGVNFMSVITWLVILVDLVLLGMWLWKQVKKG